MAISELGRAFVLFSFSVHILAQKYRVPDVTIQALAPKGIRISIPDEPNITLFAFQGNINKAINNNDVGTIKAEIINPTNGKWLYENKETQLKIGDTIYYYVFVTHNRLGYVKDKQTYVVRELVDPSSEISNDGCPPTMTVVKDGIACGGQVIFEDNFDTLREDLWQVEQYIPDEPDYPFVSYQRPSTAPTVKVADGNLRIEPKLQQTLSGFNSNSIFSGMLNLISGCTATSIKCKAEAWGASILPPIASGRLTAKKFAFKYGVVEIRAKLPKGDWLYPGWRNEQKAHVMLSGYLHLYQPQHHPGCCPNGIKIAFDKPRHKDGKSHVIAITPAPVPFYWNTAMQHYCLAAEIDILLEPVMKKYGEVNYASGIMRVAGALGNEVLLTEDKEHKDQGNKVLYGGLLMAWNCRKNLLRSVSSKEAWGDKFSVFEVRWTPDSIVFSVDGNEFARFEPNATGLIGHFDSTCELPRSLLTAGQSLAPFDDYFSITLGVAAGGITEFDDNINSGLTPKPWKNRSRKARLNFWQDLASWLPTWKDPVLTVDYVKVRAL